jgi:hypothetical protein
MEIGVPVLVVSHLGLMDFTVQLKHEPEGMTVEIRHIGFDRHLATKFEAAKSAIAQPLP